MNYKRYQTFTKDGVIWSKWFLTSETPTKWQLQGKLLNEYSKEKPPEYEPPYLSFRRYE